MNVVIPLPNRMPTLRRVTTKYNGNLTDVIGCVLLMTNDTFIVDTFDGRIVRTASRRAASEFCEIYQHAPLPLHHVDSCRYLTVHGFNLVLHDAKTL